MGIFLKRSNLARFDSIVKDHLCRVQRGTASHTSYLGHHVQNELIDLLSSKIISAIVNDIKQATIFSIILDCTPDISHTEQLSVVIRVGSLMEKPYQRTLYGIFGGRGVHRPAPGIPDIEQTVM